MKKKLGQTKILKSDVTAFLAVVLLFAVGFCFRIDLREHPFQPSELSVGYMTVSAEDSYYIIDNGKGRVSKTANGELLFEIQGTGGAKSFYQAENICIDPTDQSFYVQSVDWDESGYLLTSERILHYSSKGSYLETVYQIDYQASDEANKHRLFDLSCEQDGLRFLYVDDAGITQYFLSRSDVVQTQATYTYDRAITMLQNFSQTADGTVYAIDKHGKIVCFQNEQVYTVYQSPKDSREVLYYLAVDMDGTIYYTDIYNFEIKKVIDSTSAETVASSRNLLNAQLDSGEGQLFTVEIAQNAGQTVFTTTIDSTAMVFAQDGTVLFQADKLEQSTVHIVKTIILILLFALAAGGILYLLIRLAILYMCNRRKITLLVKVETGLVVFTVILTTQIITQLTIPFYQHYLDNLTQNIKDLAVVGSSGIRAEWIENADCAEAYMDDDYTQMSDYLYKLTTQNHDYSSRYGAEIDVIDADGRAYAIGYPDNSIGTYFPIDAASKEEIQKIYDTKRAETSDSVLNAGGTFVYGRAPIFDADGNVIAVLSVAQDSQKIRVIFEKVVTDNLISILLSIILLMFLVNEGFAFVAERGSFVNGDKTQITTIAGQRIPVHMLRTCAFATSFVLNMTSSFLSVYTSSFWSEGLGISASLAGAIPLFANGIFVAVSALFCPVLQSRIGFRKLAAIGVLCSGLGDFLAGMSRNYPSIVLALLLNGLGFGILINSISISIGTIDEADKRQAGFAKFNAGCVSGINSGMVVGSLLAARIDYHQIFYVTAVMWIMQIFLFRYLGEFLPKTTTFVKTKRKRISANGICYILLVALPYAITGSFMYYYLPIYVSEQGLSERYVSILMIIYAICGIFLSTSLTRFMWDKLKEKSVIAAVIQALLAWLMLSYYKNFYLAAFAMLMLGISFSYGVNVAIEAYLQSKGISHMKEDDAMSVYNFTSSIGQSVSSIICGMIAAVGMFFGMKLYAGLCVIAVLLYFVFGNRKRGQDIEPT